MEHVHCRMHGFNICLLRVSLPPIHNKLRQFTPCSKKMVRLGSSKLKEYWNYDSFLFWNQIGNWTMVHTWGVSVNHVYEFNNVQNLSHQMKIYQVSLAWA